MVLRRRSITASCAGRGAATSACSPSCRQCYTETVETYSVRLIGKNEQALFTRTAAARKPAVDREARAAMLELLVEVVREGTGKAARLAVPSAGKTGTSQNYRDAWFVGFTPDIVVGV